MDSLSSFYKGKKIFVTGHTGFKGAWLVQLLNVLGAKIKGYALPAENKSLFRLAKVDNICQHIEGDIRNELLLTKEILSFQPDIIIHLAAQPLVLDSYQRPAYTFEVNQMGTIYLLEALRKLEKQCTTLIITTDKVYEDKHLHRGYTEDDRLGGFDPYSASKATVELAVSSYRNSFFNTTNYDTHNKSVATARAGNVIGGGDFAENRIIPDIIKALTAKKDIILRNPNALRPWQHVLDALFGYITLIENLYNNPSNKELNSGWNFGPVQNDTFSVEKFTQIAIKQWGDGKYSIQNNQTSFKETNILRLDITKASSVLGWKPKWEASMAIKNTIEWYKHIETDKRSALDITENQISNFLNQ